LAAAVSEKDPETRGLSDRLNGERHELALRVFMAVVLTRWAEHLLQAFQIYVLGWPVPEARGLLGYFYPWLIKSEALHYGYAIVMLVGLDCRCAEVSLPAAATGKWWTVALSIQFFHHIEHLLLLIQAQSGHNLAGRPVPTSLVQFFVPRVELHLFYNTIVFIPMVVAMYYHLFPSSREASAQKCTCSWHNEAALA
jgi:hypothetical protein